MDIINEEDLLNIIFINTFYGATLELLYFISTKFQIQLFIDTYITH